MAATLWARRCRRLWLQQLPPTTSPLPSCWCCCLILVQPNALYPTSVKPLSCTVHQYNITRAFHDLEAVLSAFFCIQLMVLSYSDDFVQHSFTAFSTLGINKTNSCIHQLHLTIFCERKFRRATESCKPLIIKQSPLEHSLMHRLCRHMASCVKASVTHVDDYYHLCIHRKYL